MSIRAFVAKI